MIRSDFRATTGQQNGTQAGDGRGPEPPHRSLPLPLLVGGALAILLLGVLGGLRFAHSSSKPVPTPSPQEALSSAVVGPKQVLLGDYRDGRTWLTFYHTQQDLLGEPQEKEGAYGQNADCVIFLNYIACHSTDPGVKGSPAEFQLLPLGERYVHDHNTPRKLDAPEASTVQQYIAHNLQPQGRDWFYWLGRPISEAICSNQGNVCYQAFERQILQWPNKPEVAPTEVRLTPLGGLYPAP